MKKILLLLLIFVLGFSFAACGGSTDTSGDEGTNASEPKEDYVLVEDMYCEDYGSFYYSFCKVRNNYTEDLDNIVVSYQILDENNDVIDDGDFYAQDLGVGQGSTEQDQALKGTGDYKGNLSKVYAYKFVSYELRKIEGNTITWEEEYKFKDPIVFIHKGNGKFERQ